MVVRTRLRAILTPLLLYAASGAMSAYFIQTALHGERGVKTKDEYKALKRAIKDAKKSEKLFRKSRDAEAQTVKRHQKAQTNEHKASKALSKAKAEHEKYAADLAKTFEDLDIKKRHTESTRTGYEESKRRIDELRNQKTVNDQARSRQAAELHGVGGR